MANHNHIRLDAGSYTAVTDCVVSLMRSESQIEWREIRAGKRFEIPHHVNQFWSALTYYPEFGDAKPVCRKEG